ncbi:NEAT domain-containing protein [Weissella confusa]
MIKKILITVALSLTTILTPTYFVSADSYTVPMQVLENGTNKTSYAAAYFAGSATVTPSDNGYSITSTITTDTSLGNYPVQMLSVDGGGVSIAKSQAGNNQTITYTFRTNDLNARHNANIRVDVDNINYHHNYTVGLVVDGSTVPAPQQATVASSSVAQHSATTSSDSSTSTQSSVTSESVSTDSSSITSNNASSTTSVSSEVSTSANVSDKKKVPVTKKEVTPQTDTATSETPLPIAAIIGGGLVIGIAGAVALNLLKKK